MDYVRVRTHVADHHRFLEAGPHARDLWTWGMLYVGRHETDGHVPMSAVLASPWGYGSKANVRAAQRLVEVGLWERTSGGYVVRLWAEQGNLTKSALEALREKERSKKQRQRGSRPQGTDRGTPQGTPEGVLNSPSYSLSLSGSGGGAGGTMPGTGQAPDWFREQVDSVAMTTGEQLDLAVEWVGYQAHCESRSDAPSPPGSRVWLARSARMAKASRMRAPRVNGASKQPRGDVAWAVDRSGFDEVKP